MIHDHAPVCPVCLIKGHSSETCPLYISAVHHISAPVDGFKRSWMDLGQNGPLLGGALFLASKVIDMAPHAFWPRQQLVGTINMEMYRRDWRDGRLLAELRIIGDASEEPEHATWQIDRHTSSLLENHADMQWEGLDFRPSQPI
ncbi:hypothetical protein P168DRAFT_315507 [Aspergillus campestris IBT 28561]|uniref:Uncharacterized protein n=1 Tax=Aspergillus campestris (strain IBT 28561) TaxID=1392248 RepID=A0A2I1DAR9_ASPC2|nr:uncharacterized protein P168DRAFT_315507 [Aspergillus campestris IBT 28561]PKY06976.1 hypothetical protein P168DRAFT_315507 [Aspergillus campestris IBT 28561]